MIPFTRVFRFLQIQQVLVKYALEDLVLENSSAPWLAKAFYLYPARWGHPELRTLPRGERIRRALEELGPIFVKFGQILSTRRDLLPDDIGDELAQLQDRVAPFDASLARQEIEQALGEPLEQVFADFEAEAMASASIAQVHAATLKGGESVVVKVLRPGIEKRITKDVELLYLIAKAVQKLGGTDGVRLKPVEVVKEFEKTIYDELDLQREAANATELRRNFESSEILYVPEVFWDYTRRNVMVIERIYGTPVRDTALLRDCGTDMKLLAERGVEIFFTQVFRDNFFHADMHPGNIFVDAGKPASPTYIAVDFGIVGTLTEFDRDYLAENFLAFFRRDYRRVAQLHIDSGWVPDDTRVEEFEGAIRTVCEPIFEKPLEEISFGQVLLRLFQTARRFNMEVQPQLVLLQKTLLNIEGMGRDIYPQLDLWTTAKPYLEDWVKEQRGPCGALKRLVEQAPLWLQHSPEMPMLIHSFLRNNTGKADNHSTAAQRRGQLAFQRALLRTLTGGFVLLAGAVAWLVLFLQAGYAGLPLWIAAFTAGAGLTMMLRASRQL
ncbi:ubiquinone biosynthesis regulatory protein kinase UbiB [Granulosicoccaceae sp. 1_MG-2023]|nr:ubiquinone biosynthesis regulatory protein kinase UbiB [Granulosicoccaceae sp. 1_MG-2023]